MGLCTRIALACVALSMACRVQAPPPSDKEQFAAFMREHWGPPEASSAEPIPLAAVHRARRAALGALFPGRTLIIPTGHLKYRIQDTPFAFRPGNAFYYLCGVTEPDNVLVLAPVSQASGTHEAVLFAAPTFDPNDARFYRDARDGALWVGPRPSLRTLAGRYGIDKVRPLSELSAYLQQARSLWAPEAIALRGLDADVDGAVAATPDAEADLTRALARLRLVKDDHEIAALRRACETTRTAFDAVLRTLPLARSEHDLDVAFGTVAQKLGNGSGYLPIVAAGPHATILHWRHNDGPMRAGDVLLMDAGVEDTSLYTADITRTFAVSGHFTPVQRRVYDMVYAAREAAFGAIRPGVPWTDVGAASNRVLKQGLVQLGILQDANTSVPLHQRYTLHGVSHMLGLDVHDCGEAGKALAGDGNLQVGMVFTVEPGLYFQPNDLTVPKALRGLGIRIEDDVVVTERGWERLCEIPAQADAVEAWATFVRGAGDSTGAAPDSATGTR